MCSKTFGTKAIVCGTLKSYVPTTHIDGNIYFFGKVKIVYGIDK